MTEMGAPTKYKISAVYGNSHIRLKHKEAWHTGVYVQHPDGSTTPIADGATSDSNARATEAIEKWKLNNPPT